MLNLSLAVGKNTCPAAGSDWAAGNDQYVYHVTRAQLCLAYLPVNSDWCTVHFNKELSTQCEWTHRT